ncbi:MAG: sugar phosphate isomerase/epimerase [Mogibacterium sp.]|nr:sugar phosphate isomerase/epimerase [Mogibacterium sp.]
MAVTHRIGISSFAYCFACGSRPFTKPQHIMTTHDLIDKAVTLGADVVQFGDNMPLEVYSDEELEQIRIHAERCGIELEAGMRKSTSERLSDYIRITHKIGGRVLRVITDGIGFTPELNDICRILVSVIPQLEESGVVLGIENHDRFSAREYAKMVEMIDHPQVGLTIDTVNSLSHEENLDEVLKYMAPYCVCLHMKDYVIRRYNGGGGLKITGASLGTGRLDVPGCYKECRIKSNRSFNIILESWMEPCETLEETLSIEDEWVISGVSYLKTII